MGQSDIYQEYTPLGEVARGLEKHVPKTKYEEDVHPAGHSSVYGSWYDTKTHRWGYSCCRNTHQNAYCTGKYKRETNIAEIKKKASKKRALPTAAKAPEGMDAPVAHTTA